MHHSQSAAPVERGRYVEDGLLYSVSMKICYLGAAIAYGQCDQERSRRMQSLDAVTRLWLEKERLR